MAKSMKWYIENNDFEGALGRFNSTTPSWKDRWFDTCAQIFNNCKELAKTYVLNPIERTIQKVVTVATKTFTERITAIEQACDLKNESSQKCYLFTFYDANDNMVCSKIGTTTRAVLQRLKEELQSKTYKNMGCVRAVINRVYDCGNLPAEGLESYFRATYIKRYPDSFKKNDRFISTFFDLAEADRIAEKYLAQGLTKPLPYAILSIEREVHNMNTYTIYLGAHSIACVKGAEYSFEVFRRTMELAEVLNISATLFDDSDGEILAHYDPENF